MSKRQPGMFDAWLELLSGQHTAAILVTAAFIGGFVFLASRFG